MRDLVARVLVAVCACLLALAATPLTRAQEPGTPAAIETVELQWPPELDQVRARRQGRLLVLEGTVVREADRELAEKVARANGDSSEILNRIEVDAPLGPRLRTALEASVRKLVRMAGQLPLLLIALFVGWLFWRAGRWLSQRSWIGRSGKRNPFAVEIVRQAMRLVAGVVGLLVVLEMLDATALATALLGSAGVAGIAIGFAFRDLLENYIAGVLLSIRQPFAPDDHIVIEGREGIVVGMNSRATLLMTPDGNHLTLPNAVVFKAIVLNYTRNGKRRFSFQVAVDPAMQASAALVSGLEALRATPGVLADPKPVVHVAEMTREELRLQFHGWVDQRESSFNDVRSEALRAARRALKNIGADFRPAAFRLVQEADAPAPPAAAGVAQEPVEPVIPPAQSDPAAVQDAVRETRAEMGDTNLMQRGERE
jgi:small conductance mechanosensitive channel